MSPPGVNGTAYSQDTPSHTPSKNAQGYHSDQFFAEHNFRAATYRESFEPDPFSSSTEFLDLLDSGGDISSGITVKNARFSLRRFVDSVNVLAESIQQQHFPHGPLLVVKDTESKTPLGSFTKYECQPAYTAAFEHHWTDEDVTLWPCIRLIGEKASKGTTEEDQQNKVISYLHYLLLARPDLYVAQGFLTTKEGVTFLLGIAGTGIRSWDVSWKSDELAKAMYVFVYRLYEPGNFADPSYVRTNVDLETGIVTYDVEIFAKGDTGSTTEGRSTQCLSAFRPIYACSPFQTRTHVFANPSSETLVDGTPLTVLKVRICQSGMQSDEYGILTHIHEEGAVPGVVEAVFHDETLVSFLGKSRVKRRIGMRQYGTPFLGIKNLQEVLKVVFDTLEGLRHLHSQRRVLHRNISTRNVMFVGNDTPTPPTTHVTLGASSAREKHNMEDLCFVNYLLGESSDRLETSALLGNFHNAEHLTSNTGVDYKKNAGMGTLPYIARAVEVGKPLSPPSHGIIFDAIPASPEIYKLNHPERVQRVPPEEVKFVGKPPAESTPCQWRRELNHDVESAFWLLFDWAMLAQPIDREKEEIPAAVWSNLLGGAASRKILISRLQHSLDKEAVHCLYAQHLLPLIQQLSSMLNFDRSWVPSSDPRYDPEYLAEVFQRWILHFLIDHRESEFMKWRIGVFPREVERISQWL